MSRFRCQGREREKRDIEVVMRKRREIEKAVIKCHNLLVILQMVSRLLAVFHCFLPKNRWRATVSPLKTAVARDAFTQSVISLSIMHVSLSEKKSVLLVKTSKIIGREKHGHSAVRGRLYLPKPKSFECNKFSFFFFSSSPFQITKYLF